MWYITYNKLYVHVQLESVHSAHCMLEVHIVHIGEVCIYIYFALYILICIVDKPSLNGGGGIFEYWRYK